MPATISGSHLGLDTHANRPAANAAGQPVGALYSCSTHNLIYKTDGSSWATWGTLSGGSGSVATDTIWDAAGDLVQGTGADAAAKLSAGTTAMVLTSAGAAAANAWKFPPGYKYSEVTYTDVSVTGTTEGGAQTVATSASIALDGVISVYVEFYTPRLILGTAAGNGMVIDLYVDSTIQGRLAVLLNPASAADDKPLYLKSGSLTPSNASHTFTVKAWRINGNGTVSGGAGGTGTNLPGYIRVVKA